MKLKEEIKKIEYPNYESMHIKYDSFGNVVEKVKSYQDGPFVKSQYFFDSNRLTKEIEIFKGSYGEVGAIFEKNIEYNELGYTAIKKKINEIHDSYTTNELGNIISIEDYFKTYNKQVSEIVEIEELTYGQNNSILKLSNLKNRTTSTIKKFFNKHNLIIKIEESNSEGLSIINTYHYDDNNNLIKKITTQPSIQKVSIYKNGKIIGKTTSEKFSFSNDFYVIEKKKYSYSNNEIIEETLLDSELNYISLASGKDEYKSEVTSIIESYKDNTLLYSRNFTFENKNEFSYSCRRTILDFEDKLVLLEFWASNCGPCRQENPNLVKTYEKYKPKGFEIYAVSQDTKKSSWLNAIKKDKLPWLQVSDLKGRDNSASLIYGINGIPDNFLIDKSGIIIGRNLRGEKLNEKLEELLK